MSTYKGNNIGLSFDGTGWSYTNIAQDFIDTSAFSTEEPEFPTATESTTPDEETPNCPAGYIYDETLKQCVPDPSIQNPYMQQDMTGGGSSDSNPVQIPGTNRFTTDNNFIATDAEYENMSPKDLIENYKARGYITKDEQGNLIVDLNRVDFGANVMDNILGKFGSGGGEGQARKKKLFKFLMDKNLVNSKLNPDIFNFYPTGGQAVTSDTFPVTRLTGEMGKIVLPKYLSSTVGTSFISPTMADVAGTTKDSSIVSTKVKNFADAALNKVIVDVTPGTSEMGDKYSISELDAIERRKKEAEARAAEIKAEKEQLERDKLADELDAMIPDNKDKDSNIIGTSQSGDTNVIIRKKPKKSKKQPSGGTTLGSSVHGTGSYNPGGSNTSSSSSVPSGNTPGFSGNPFIDR